MTYPPDWPKCPRCGEPALDGHITCGDVACNEGAERAKRDIPEGVTLKYHFSPAADQRLPHIECLEAGARWLYKRAQTDTAKQAALALITMAELSDPPCPSREDDDGAAEQLAEELAEARGQLRTVGQNVAQALVSASLDLALGEASRKHLWEKVMAAAHTTPKEPLPPASPEHQAAFPAVVGIGADDRCDACGEIGLGVSWGEKRPVLCGACVVTGWHKLVVARAEVVAAQIGTVVAAQIGTVHYMHQPARAPCGKGAGDLDWPPGGQWSLKWAHVTCEMCRLSKTRLTLAEAREKLGARVIYWGQPQPERGVITSVNDEFVFVDYGDRFATRPSATRPEDLSLSLLPVGWEP